MSTNTGTPAVAGPSGVSGTASTNVATAGNARANRNKMPQPGTKNAPFFDKEKPEELHRFFERMEDWFNEDGITDDDELKKRIVRYMDVDTEQQWKAFASFDNGTFADLKKAILASYPKARELTKGSVQTLNKKVKEIGPISTSDRDELQKLIRIMRTETGKLAKITPPIHTNRELVDIFRSRLDDAFKTMLGMKLIMRREAARLTQPQAAVQARDPEDLYDLSEIMEIAAELGQENDPFARHAISTGTKVQSESTVKLEAMLAQLMDTVTIQNKRSESLEQRLVALQAEQKQAMQSRATYSNTSNQSQVQSNTVNKDDVVSYIITCYYCGKTGHRISDCADVLSHLQKGWIKRVDGRLKLPDGSKIPQSDERRMKDTVELLNKKGTIPVSKIADKASLAQSKALTSLVQSVGNDEEEVEALKMLSEVLQRVGFDTVHRALSDEYFTGTQSTTQNKEESSSNFD